MTRQVLLTITADIDADDIHRRIANAFADVDGECRVSIRTQSALGKITLLPMGGEDGVIVKAADCA